MKKKTLLSIAMIACLGTSSLFAGLPTVTVAVTITGQVPGSGVIGVIHNYDIPTFDAVDLALNIDDTITVNSSGNYSSTFSITIPDASFLGYSEVALPVYIVFTQGSKVDIINENIPIDVTQTATTHVISKSPSFGAYVPKIGLVTVDTAKNMNMVAWESKDTTIQRYSILRAVDLYSNTYDIIGSVNQKNTDSVYSVFRDKSIIPGQQKAFYKIVAVYKDSSRSQVSNPMAALSLSIVRDAVTGLPNLNLIDKNDIALFDQSFYKAITIYKSTSNVWGNFVDTLIHTDFSSFTDVATLLQAVEDADTATNFYYVAKADLQTPCKPSLLKSDAGPFSQSLSNMAESQLTTTAVKGLTSNVALSASPNPSKGTINLTIPSNGNLSILDLTGKVVVNQAVKTGELKLSIKQPGMYIAILNANKSYSTKIIIE